MTNVHHFRNKKRLRLVERLCERSLFTADLALTPLAIPLEPDELVRWDREHLFVEQRIAGR